MPLAPITIRPVTEILHGVQVSDRFRWLEDRNRLETIQWIREQKLLYNAYFAHSQELGLLRNRVRGYLNREVIDQPARLGSMLFYRRRRADQEQGAICIREGTRERTLFDPSCMGTYASATIQAISDDGRLLAIALKRDGSGRTEALVLSAETGAILEDSLPLGYIRGFAFAPASTGFYYCHETPNDDSDHTIRRHWLGRPGGRDETVFRVSRTAGSALFVIGEGRRIGAVHLREHDGLQWIDFSLCSSIEDPSAWITVFRNKSAPHAPLLWNGRTFLLTDEGAPNRRLIEVAENGDVLREVIPECGLLLQQLVLAGDRVYAGYLIDRRPAISAWSLDGEHLEDVPFPSDGSITLLDNFNSHCASLFAVHESFSQPPQILEYTPATGVTKPFCAECRAGSAPDLRVEEVVYRSHGGVEVPMSIVRNRNAVERRPAPLVLTGYGGFGVAMTPRFSVLVTILLELGAAFAIPNIRGGSEFGKGWHEAGRRRKRMVAIRDFLAAAEWLIREGITSSDRLGIFGGSNSGLLVAAAMTQRPDLFRAVLSIAPLLDMIRFDRFDQARQWHREYGSPLDPEDFAALLEYSPYHNVAEFSDYPATLFVSGDADDRCNPAHVRKMAALLQNREAQKNAVIVDYTRKRGHSPVLPLSIRVEALARRLVFLCRELSISVPEEAGNELAVS
jgi:prolyl oligopeptidase